MFCRNVQWSCLPGLKIDGIYRVSGNLAQIQKLRFMVDHSKLQNISTTITVKNIAHILM